MKKFWHIMLVILLFQSAVNANYNDIYIANIEYDWINKNDLEKEAIINEVHDILFEKDFSKIKGCRKDFKDKIKDKEYKEHYLAAASGYKEYKDYNISAFYYRNQKYIYMYGLQDKKDVFKIYYYDALGHLRYVDDVKGEYPLYPYCAYQYSVSGKPIGAIYYLSQDNQYLYTPEGKFKGVWYKHNLYDKHSKVILKRTTY